MSAAEQLLVRTHKNAEMGKNTLEKLIPMIKDRDLQAVLQLQHDEYNRIFMSADILLRSNGVDSNGLSTVMKAMGNMMIDFNTMTNKSTSNVARMVIEGVDRGIKEIDESLTQYGASSSAEAFNLASTLRDFLYRNRRELQRYK